MKKDYKEAANWYQLAAEQGDASSQHALGYMYNEGLGVTKNPLEAEKWFQLAEKQGLNYSRTPFPAPNTPGLVLTAEKRPVLHIDKSSLNSQSEAGFDDKDTAVKHDGNPVKY
ncbi:tetratricopeptide repeat protein [Methylomonas sp. CM2]|uniref:tetratricopeptide repeat protein n=1 Tax=Methylomonas sp. CM2 TaxID=3417647 RepID=UPI003CEF8F52